MHSVPLANAKAIEPHHLGPLDEQARPGPSTGSLFSGVERYLGKGERKRRTALWTALSERIGRLCAEDEHVLYFAPAMQKISLLQYIALGALVMKYHQVALVITDRRVIEVLLEFDGKTVSERARSYSWANVAEAKLSFGKLVLKPVDGKNTIWHLRKRGDRKLLKLLLPKISERLLTRQGAAGQGWPEVHCPSCNAALAAKPKRCDACGTQLRSTGLAASLSLAFPGAGLFYAGHPVLGTFDLIGESFIFLIVASMFLVANNATEIATAAVGGLFLVALTKLESLHLGHVLVSRMRTESPQRRQRWKKGAIAGGSVSALAVIAVLLGVGSLADGIDRDLDFSSPQAAWVGSRVVSDWEMFVDDPDLRSQWYHSDGWVASVFAYPLAPGQTADSFRQDFSRHETENGANVLIDDESLPQGFDGFRFVEEFEGDDAPVVIVHYFVHDPQGSDIHQLLMAVQPDQAGEAESVMRDLLAQAQWIEAAPPTY